MPRIYELDNEELYVVHDKDQHGFEEEGKRSRALDVLSKRSEKLYFSEIEVMMQGILPEYVIQAGRKLNELGGDSHFLFKALELYLIPETEKASHSGELINVHDIFAYHAECSQQQLGCSGKDRSSFYVITPTDVTVAKLFAQKYVDVLEERVDRVKHTQANLYDSALFDEDRKRIGSILHLLAHIEEWRDEKEQSWNKNATKGFFHIRNALQYGERSESLFDAFPDMQVFLEGERGEESLRMPARQHMHDVHVLETQDYCQSLQLFVEQQVFSVLREAIISPGIATQARVDSLFRAL